MKKNLPEYEKVSESANLTDKSVVYTTGRNKQVADLIGKEGQKTVANYKTITAQGIKYEVSKG
jgi:uncharacterized protein (UPF0333 family)